LPKPDLSLNDIDESLSKTLITYDANQKISENDTAVPTETIESDDES
jgi:hypothetical protein